MKKPETRSTKRSATPTRAAAKPRSTARRNGNEQEFGEGNYKATRDYDRAAAAFAKSGAVGPAARAAAPRNKREAVELAKAEAEGLARSKGEDPALHLENFFGDLDKP